jgi:hypothetical protein
MGSEQEIRRVGLVGCFVIHLQEPVNGAPQGNGEALQDFRARVSILPALNTRHDGLRHLELLGKVFLGHAEISPALANALAK